MILSNKCVLNDRYVIQGVLGEVGPFDVNYIAWDLNNEKEVVVREYYPLSLAKREQGGTLLEVHDPGRFEYGLGAYTAEGLLLGKISHDGVATHIEQFKQNGTVYCVDEYVTGASLAAYVKQQGGSISADEALLITTAVLQGLQAIHEKRLYHGGISPRTIYLTTDGHPVILGFQGARFKLARECGSLPDIITPGYSAPEQIEFKTEEGPWWDVFGCASTLFHMISGQHLPDLNQSTAADQLGAAFLQVSGLSIEVREVLQTALAYDYGDRPASAKAMSDMLEEARQVAALHLQSSDGLPRLEIGFEPTISATPQESASTDTTYKSDGSAPASIQSTHTTLQEVQDKVEHEISDVIPQDIPQLHTEPPRLLAPSYNAGNQTADNGAVREKELELLLAKVVKGQQVFVAFILGLVFLVLLVVLGGIFFRPAILQQFGMQPAQAEVESSSAEIAAAAGVEIEETEPESSESETTGETSEAPEVAAAASVLVAEEENDPAPVEDDPVNEEFYGDIFEPALESDETLDGLEDDEESSDSSESDDESSIATVDDTEDDESEIEEGDDGETTTDEEELDGELIAEDDSLAADPVQIDPAVEAALQRERQYLYYRTQGDSLSKQGFTLAALQWYKSAQRYKDGDAYVSQRIQSINDSLQAISTAQAQADSLAARIEQARDQQGIFVLPDTPAKLVDEAGVRESIVYPIGAVQMRVEGRVTIRFIIDEQGQLGEYRIIKSVGAGCDDVVLRALQEAEFEPATFNGEPVKSWSIFTTVFKL